MKIQIPDYIQVLIDLLNQNGYSAYVVGGAIRNALLELPIHDYDLTTDATPQEMLQVFSNYRVFQTGIQHGTITVLSNKQPVEITTFRSESIYEDHRHPSGFPLQHQRHRIALCGRKRGLPPVGRRSVPLPRQQQRHHVQPFHARQFAVYAVAAVAPALPRLQYAV